MWPETADAPLISSFARTCVAVARDEQPQWPRSFLFDRRPEGWRDLGKELRLTGFGANQRHLDETQVKELKDAGFRLTAYTVNDVERARTLFAWGVDAIFSDAPAVMVPLFERKP
jgi:glycerophosphoryl diester phosphodiesterase